MKKDHKALILLFFVSSLLITNMHAANTPIKTFWHVVGTAAAAVAAGVGAYKILDWCFSETNDQLLARAEREYNNASQYVDTMSLFEQAYNIVYADIQERKLVFNRLYEPCLYTIAKTLFDRGIVCTSYVNDVVRAKGQLLSLSSQLHSRIKEQQGSYVDTHTAHTLNNMYSLMHYIDEYLPHLSLFADYVEHHKNYFTLFDAEASLNKKYDTELRIVKSGSLVSTMVHDVRQSVAWNHSDKRYSFLAFVSYIESDCASLRDKIRSLSYNYSERIHYATWLLESLEWIKKAITSDERYAYQVYQAEQERLERLQVEALQEKACIERAQLYAQQEQNRLLAHNNALHAHHIAQDAKTSQVTIVVN